MLYFEVPAVRSNGNVFNWSQIIKWEEIYLLVLRPMLQRGLEIGGTPPQGMKHNHVFYHALVCLKYEIDGCGKNNPFFHILLQWFLLYINKNILLQDMLAYSLLLTLNTTCRGLSEGPER